MAWWLQPTNLAKRPLRYIRFDSPTSLFAESIHALIVHRPRDGGHPKDCPTTQPLFSAREFALSSHLRSRDGEGRLLVIAVRRNASVLTEGALHSKRHPHTCCWSVHGHPVWEVCYSSCAGDPGLGKSQMLRSVASISPRGVYVSGRATTNSGLTVTVVKEGNDFALEAGALVMADMGTCCIDEFDKMSVLPDPLPYMTLLG